MGRVLLFLSMLYHVSSQIQFEVSSFLIFEIYTSYMMINYMMSHHWWPITYRLLFSLKSVAIVAITEEKVICGPSSTVSSLNSTDSSTTISSSISTFDHNSTGSDDVTCYEYKYKFSEVMTSQFLAAYFYGKYKFISFTYLLTYL